MLSGVAGLGSRAHQALIEHVVAHYSGDDRIRAVAVFGSDRSGVPYSGKQGSAGPRAYRPAARNAAPISARAAPLASSTCSSSRALTGSRKPALIRPWPSRSRSEPGNP
jgi:hypothetical protein